MKTMTVLESLGSIGSFAQGAAAVIALGIGLNALRDWERKRARDRRADVATRVIRLVAVSCEDMSAAVLAPAMRVGYAEIASRDERRGFIPVSRDMIRNEFERRMSRALEQLREVFMIHVEARVHLNGPGEVEALGQFISACHDAETGANGAVESAEDDLSSGDVRKEVTARLTSLSERVIEARERVVSVLGPVARDGRPASNARGR